VRALARVAVVAGDVPAAVGDTANGIDPQVVVVHRAVADELRSATVDTETVLSRVAGEVGLIRSRLDDAQENASAEQVEKP